MTLSDRVHQVGQELAAAKTDHGLAEVLNAVLPDLFGGDFRATSARLVDLEGKESPTFATVVHVASAPLSSSGAVGADGVAAVIDVAADLTLDRLRDAYRKIAEAKSLRKTPVPMDRDNKTNVTLGLILAGRSEAPLEAIEAEMASLNLAYPSNHWPDMIVIAGSAVINYAVQFPGESISGDVLPPAENALQSGAPAFYVVTVIRPTGTFAFNHALQFACAHLWLFEHSEKLPDRDAISAGVTKGAVTYTGYQYNLGGQLVPVPRELYNDRYLPPRPLLIEGPSKEVLSTIEFLRWQDGGVILLKGKLPLEGLMIFMPKTDIPRRVIRRPEAQISYVLPINEADFRGMLVAFQKRSNMTVRRDTGSFVVQKLSDEGTSTPLLARTMLGIMSLREKVFADGTDRREFDRLYDSVTSSLFSARTSVQEITRGWEGHAQKISTGEAAKVIDGNLHITESIDRELRRDFEAFLNATTRTAKTSMQYLTGYLGVDIGFLFKKQSAFQTGLAALKGADKPLASYLEETRGWLEPLMLLRNEMEHATWDFPRVKYDREGDKVIALEPSIEGASVTRYVDEAFDRLSSLVEEITAHCLQKKLPEGITITEVPLTQRRADDPERFRITLSNGGEPAWQLTYHSSRFEET